jgi:hypothetical protein
MNRPAADLPDARLEDELRAAFADATAGMPPTRDPWARTTRAVARSRARRRAGALAIAAVAAVAVVASLLPFRPSTAPPSQRTPGPTVTSTDVTTWPTRGDLADRADLLAGVRAVAPEVDGGRLRAVPFLGQVDGLVVALAVIEGGDPGDSGDHSTLRLVALTGPASQPVSSWDREVSSLEATGLPVLSAAVRRTDGEARLVVVTPSSGFTAGYSPRPEIDAGGRVQRRFTDLALDNGVGTATWRGPVTALTVQVQAAAGGSRTSPPQLLASPQIGPPPPDRENVDVSCSAPGFENLRLNLGNAATSVAWQAGYDVSEIRQARAAWCRRVGRHDVMFVVVTLADGITVQTSLQTFPTNGGVGATYSNAYPVPPERADTTRGFVPLVGEDLADGAGRTVLLWAPGGASAELLATTANGRAVVGRARLDAGGVGVAKATAAVDDAQKPGWGFSLVVRDSSGRELEQVPLPAHVDDPWLHYGGVSTD